MEMNVFFENIIKMEETTFQKGDFDKHGYKYLNATINEVKKDGFVYLGSAVDDMKAVKILKDISDITVNKYIGLPVSEAMDLFLSDFGVKWDDICKAYYGHLEEAAKKADSTNVTAIQEGLTALVAGHIINASKLENRLYSIDDLSKYFDFNGAHKSISPKELDWNAVLRSGEWIHSIVNCGSDNVINTCKNKTRAVDKNVKYIPVHEHLSPLGNFDFRFLYDDRHYGLKNKDMVQPADIFLVDSEHEKELYDALRFGIVPAVQYANGNEEKLQKIFDRGGTLDDSARATWENYYKWSDEEEAKLDAKAAETGKRISLQKSKKYKQLNVEDEFDKNGPLFKRRQSIVYNMNICTIMGWILPISLKKVESGEPHVKYSELGLYVKDDPEKTKNTNVNVVYNGSDPNMSTVEELFIIKPTKKITEKDGKKVETISLACPFISVTPEGFKRLQLGEKANKYFYKNTVQKGMRVKVSGSDQMEIETGDGGFGGKCGNATNELGKIINSYREAKKPSKGEIVKVFEFNEYTPEFLEVLNEYPSQFLGCVNTLLDLLKKGLDQGISLTFMLSIFLAKSLKYKLFCDGEFSEKELKAASASNDAICNYFKVS